MQSNKVELSDLRKAYTKPQVQIASANEPEGKLTVLLTEGVLPSTVTLVGPS